MTRTLLILLQHELGSFRMDDPQAPPIGTLGTVIGVDAIGTIHVDWDNGCGLGVAYGEDDCRRIDG